MRFLYILLTLLLLVPRQDKVLVCEGDSAYRYHSHMCQGLKRCTHVIDKMSVKEAIRMGRTPCLYCYPGAVQRSPGSGGDGQCQAITRKGARCSRAARSNGYCWQHGG